MQKYPVNEWLFQKQNNKILTFSITLRLPKIHIPVYSSTQSKHKTERPE